jgi:ABC-type transport system involved in multi-copper enzyme maturation permease subunit
LILGFAYKIPNVETYSAKLAGQTTKEVYQSFTSSDSRYDTKQSLDAIIADASALIDVHNSKSLEAERLSNIKTEFESIWDEVERFNLIGECTYTTNEDISQITTATSDFEDFLNDFKALEQFHSRLLITESQMDTFDDVLAFFQEKLSSSSDIATILRQLYAGKSNFTALTNAISSTKTFNIDSVRLSNFTTNYIEKAKQKLDNIYAEMTSLNSSVSTADVKKIDDMKSLATNYKLTCQSAKAVIEDEFKLLMDNLSIKISNLYGYEKYSLENTKLSLALEKEFISDDGLYYTQYQQALNFNTASYQTTAYDHAYFMMCIIGFLTIIFGIYCAYKLFGVDRKNGKVDLILSQKVTFNQVFAGKFLAILWTTSFCLLVFAAITLGWGAIFYGFLPNSVLAVFNLETVYTISPFWFFVIKLIGIELQVIFFVVLTIFMMNISRKFALNFAVTLTLFAVVTICNIFLRGQLWYCLLPFIHSDITSFLGGATMETGFLKTSLYAYGNFYISLIYYLVVVGLLFNFTKQLFKKN